jgi:hypothetical protein
MAALLKGPATRQDFDLYAGRDYVLSIPTVNNEDGSPYVFEPDTTVYWWLGLDKNNPMVAKISSDPAQITITGNTVFVRIKNSDTTELKASSSNRVYMHELEIIDPDNNKFTACIGTPTVINVFDQTPAVPTGGAKLYSYDFIATPAMSSRLVLSRASVGTYINTSGTRITAAANQARFENRWNGSTWAPAGLLVEPQGKQFATNSEVFNSNPGFSAYGSMVLSSTKGANNSNFMMTYRSGTQAASTASIDRSSSGQTGQYFASVDVRFDNWNFAILNNNNANHVWTYAVFNLSSATITDTVNNGVTGIASFRRLRDNIYRLMLIGGDPNTVYTAVGLARSASGNSATSTYGDPLWSPPPTDTEKVFVGGVTCSPADYETSHIPSSGGIATRSADVLTPIGLLPYQLAAGPSVWELTDLVTGATTRTSFAPGTFTFPTKKLYRSFAVYVAGTDTSPFMTVGGPY